MTFSQVRSYVKELIKSLGLTPVEGLSSSDIQDLKDAFDVSNSSVINPLSPGFTPIGTIISVMGNTAPPNYLICNGQTVNISDYPELADYFEEQFGAKEFFGGDGINTFGIPDLRGEFLRGSGTNNHENQGSGGDVGEHQDATRHIQLWVGTNGLYARKPSSGDIKASNMDDHSYLVPYNGTRSGTNTWTDTQKNMDITYTSRPTNTSVLYCIAIRNIYIEQIKSENIYSLDEKIIGQWIDGKPIYQKTITDLNLRLSWDGQYRAQAQLTNPIQNLDNLIDCKGVGIVSAISKPHYYDLSAYVESNGKINVMGLSGDVVKVITFQYTKTTD